MSTYPSEQNIPPIAQERAAFAAWGILSILTLLVYGWVTIDPQLRLTDLLLMVALAQPFLAMFGILGFWLRRRRLIRVKAREAFLASLARLTFDAEQAT